jgi:hypothetical protein
MRAVEIGHVSNVIAHLKILLRPRSFSLNHPTALVVEVVSKAGTKLPSREGSMDEEQVKPKAELDDALRSAQRELRRLLIDLSKNEVKARYKIGALTLRLTEGKKTYGTSAVERLARSLDYDPSSMYRDAKVAKRWPNEAEFMKMHRRRNRADLHLFWTHYLVLAKRDDWKVWLKRTLLRGLSAKQLKTELADEASGAKEAPDSRKATHDAIVLAIAKAEGSRADFASWHPLVDRYSKSPELDDQDGELIDSATSLLVELARDIEDLRSAMAVMTTARLARRSGREGAATGEPRIPLLAGGPSRDETPAKTNDPNERVRGTPVSGERQSAPRLPAHPPLARATSHTCIGERAAASPVAAGDPTSTPSSWSQATPKDVYLSRWRGRFLAGFHHHFFHQLRVTRLDDPRHPATVSPRKYSR